MALAPPEDLDGRLEQAARRARRLLGTASGREGPEAAARGLTAPRSGPPDEEDERLIARQLQGSVAPEQAKALAATLVDRARAVMARLTGGAVDGAVGARDALALEAVIHTRGRPALRFDATGIEPADEEKHPGSAIWRALLDQHRDTLLKVGAATGAVRVADTFGATPPWVQGTAWLAKPDIVVTNRHVLFPPFGQRLARRRAEAMTTAKLKSEFQIGIDLAFDHGDPRNLVLQASEVLYVAEEGDPVDIAVIRVVPPADVSLPAPLSLADEEADTSQLYVIGHPGRLTTVPNDVQAVFGSPDERKRISMGELMDPDTRFPGDLIHDASTIGGYSGGCVAAFLSPAIIGLHYYGDPENGNRAILSTALLRHPVRGFLV